MNNFNLLEGWVSSLGCMIGLDLEFDRNRVCTMLYEDNICLSLAPCEGNEDAFIITCPILALTMDPAVDDFIFRAVLKMNFLGSETGYGGVLGLGLSDGMIIFAHAFYFCECDEIHLQNIVQKAAYNIKSLREAISSHLEIEIKAESKVQETLINPLLMYGNFV